MLGGRNNGWPWHYLIVKSYLLLKQCRLQSFPGYLFIRGVIEYPGRAMRTTGRLIDRLRPQRGLESVEVVGRGPVRSTRTSPAPSSSGGRDHQRPQGQEVSSRPKTGTAPGLARRLPRPQAASPVSRVRLDVRTLEDRLWEPGPTRTHQRGGVPADQVSLTWHFAAGQATGSDNLAVYLHS